MVQRNSGIQEPDVIIVGGGRASADFIPDLCDALAERIRGVVFIDHDMGEITGLQSIINDRNINFTYVHMDKRTNEHDLFNDYVDEMGLEGYAEWDDDLTKHPPMIRVQTRLRQRDIFDAVWDLLPTQRGRLVLPRVNIVFAFGMTGMTSSTVALEAGTTIRRMINEQIPSSRVGVQSNIDAPLPRQVGIGLFPPDPSPDPFEDENAGGFNLLQGLNVANALEHTLPQNSRSTPEGAPFDKFLLIDGSGFSRDQNLQEFDEWASRSATTLLTCETITGKTFFDVNEMLNEIAPYNNLALICVGGGPEDRAATEWLHDTDDKVKRVQAGEARAGQTTKDIVSEELPSQLAIEHPQAKFNVVNEFNALKEADAELDAADEQLRYKRRNLPELNMRFTLATGPVGMIIAFPIFLILDVGLQIVQFIIPNAETLPAWMNIVFLSVCLGYFGVLFFFIGYLIKWGFSKLQQRSEVAEAIKIQARCRSTVREELEALGAKAREVAENISEYWSEVRFARMWVMPDNNDPSLPLDGDNIQLSNMNRLLGQALHHTINPESMVPDMNLKRCTVIVAGSPDAREKFPLPRHTLIPTFDGRWDIRAGQGDLDDSEPLHYLMLWEPADNRILPRFYREPGRREMGVSEIPSQYNAWPNFTE